MEVQTAALLVFLLGPPSRL